MPLPGGDAAIREPWRVAAVHLERAGLPVPWPRWQLVRQSLKLEPPLASGMGRLFDAVAAILGVREQVTYEGQAAVELEQLAGTGPAKPYVWSFGDTTGLVARCATELRDGRARGEIAARFHETVAAGAASACEHAGEPRTVVLSGGSFQNVRLLDSTRARLETRGFRVLTHRLVPPNDGGISYGQAAVAARGAAHVPGIPAQIVEIVDPEGGLAKAEISGVRRAVSIALCPEAGVGDWVLVHVGFALERIDEQQARETIELLEQMGEAYEQEVREIRASATTV